MLRRPFSFLALLPHHGVESLENSFPAVETFSSIISCAPKWDQSVWGMVRGMRALAIFFLGMMVGWMPGLLIVAWLIRRAPSDAPHARHERRKIPQRAQRNSDGRSEHSVPDVGC